MKAERRSILFIDDCVDPSARDWDCQRTRKEENVFKPSLTAPRFSPDRLVGQLMYRAVGMMREIGLLRCRRVVASSLTLS